jgi:alpha-tubulin suppressor-like RCC1 family protein
VSGLNGVVDISCGNWHSLALRGDGTVWAWGSNNFGQLGNNGPTTLSTVPVQVTGLSGVAVLSAGGNHSMALKSDGTLWAWGFNNVGQLGDGTNIQRLAPVQVSGLSGVMSISAGEDHSLALQNNGTVWAWGQGGHGQLGDGQILIEPPCAGEHERRTGGRGGRYPQSLLKTTALSGHVKQ